MEDITRPFKRQKLEHPEFRTLPSDVLLLSLPHFLVHPPTHRNHTRSLFLTLFALRKCLSLPNLDATVECRAWTGLAEIGLRIGLDEPGIESEVGRAITKALMIAQKHPSLRIYKPLITRLSARLALHQQNPKLAQNTLRKVLTNFILPSDPPHITYSAHLAYITSLSGISQDDDSGPYSPSWANLKALGAIKDLHALAIRNKHREVAQLTMVLELRDLVQNGFWTRVGETLGHNEKVSPSPRNSNHRRIPLISNLSLSARRTLKGLIIHVYHRRTLLHIRGRQREAQSRIKKLHDMLDGGAMDAFGASGIVEVELPDPPLRVQVTHPRVIFALGFLVSSVSKRDRGATPPWASTVDVKGFYDRMHKLKADMICELVGYQSHEVNSTMLNHLAQLIAHTRTHSLFSIYSGRITLHQAHLAHALGRTERALKCYQVAAILSRRRTTKKESESDEEDGCEDHCEFTDEVEWEREMKPLRKTSAEVIKECEGLGGTLQAIGAVLAACLSKEFLVAKGHLRTALNLSTSAQDNHLRALVLALVAAQYVHTSTEHAESMLSTAEQLAAGLGAQPKTAKNAELRKGAAQASVAGSGDGVGNAHLRLWIGERSLELKRRAADEQGASKQAATNEKFKEAVVRVQKRKFVEVE
ncbi:hypothetical protein BDZ97DRAFT_1925469 [Flammula alnicola]|nr:hypothetical protein BDZ97DRAFT_1925469 [Flammula alnicola]